MTTTIITDNKKFNAAVSTFRCNGVKQRENLHHLLLSGVGFVLRDKNCEPLTRLWLAIEDVRSLDKAAIARWLTAATGGYVGENTETETGGHTVDEKLACVVWDSTKQVFKMKAVPGKKEQKEKNAREIMDRLARTSDTMAGIPFWNFQKAGMPSVYKFSSLIQAVKRAGKADNLTEEQTTALESIVAACAKHGLLN